MVKDSGTLILRNYPDDDALKNPHKYPKALSFSPDIIPLYGAQPDLKALIHPTCWRGFTGMPIVGGDINNVYIRGHGSGGPYLATLRVIPSELILWPQVWSAVKPVSPGPVVISGGDTIGPSASDGHLHFRPPHTTGNAYSLIANVFKLDPANSQKNLHEYEPIPPSEKNFGVDDFISFLSKDKNFTFYTVIVADPTVNHVSANTRLRMFSKSPVQVSFRIEWHKGPQAPAGLEVSLIDDRGKIAISRTPLSSLGEHKVVLDPSYDGILTLNICSPAGSPFFEPYSGLSLQVFKSSGILGSTLQDAATGWRLPLPSIDAPQLLGALNVIFDPHSTRNLRYAGPAARKLREAQNFSTNDVSILDDGSGGCADIPVTSPAATGWWFRNQLSDVNSFPHTAPGGYTPDIQPIGTDLTAPGLWISLQNPHSDYSKDHTMELVGGEDNYIFVRGHSTIADIDIQSRVFAVTGAAVLHPAEYTIEGLSAQVFNGGGTVDQQSISVANPNQFYMFNRPFDLKAPANPDPEPNPGGAPWITKPHYCLIAEVRQKRKCSLVFPDWPSDQVEDFHTLQDFQNWVANNPLVCYRNLAWVPSTRNPGEDFLTWQCVTRLVIPQSTFSSTFWTVIVECDNPIIPPGSKWSLACDDNVLFPNGLCFGNTLISTQSPAYAGCHFTGAAPGRPSSNLMLTVTWADRSHMLPLPSVKIKFATTEVSTLSPVAPLASPPPPGSDTWPFYVGINYPYVGDQPNPSPLPSFAGIGLNPWPYPGAPQFPLGQVALAAMPAPPPQ